MGTIARRSITNRFLLDRCNISRGGNGEGTLNETTFAVEPAEPTVIHEGIRCQLTDRVRSRSVDDGDAAVAESESELKLPADTEDLEVGDVVTITESADPETVGRVLVVIRVLSGTHSITRTLYCRRAAAFGPFGLVS